MNNKTITTPRYVSSAAPLNDLRFPKVDFLFHKRNALFDSVDAV